MADDHPAPDLVEERRRPEQPAWLRIGVGVIGTLGGVLVIFAMLAWMLTSSPPVPNVPPDPEVPSRIAVLEEVRAHDEAMLTSYGWVDEEKGVVRIPVDAAFDKLIEERKKGD